jgi:hypothetical protein
MTRVSASGEHRAGGRIEKGQLDLRLQHKSARQERVGTAGRQGLHARPQRRQCPHDRTPTAARGAIVVRLDDRRLILKEDADSSAEQGEIARAGDDAGTAAWDREHP